MSDPAGAALAAVGDADLDIEQDLVRYEFAPQEPAAGSDAVVWRATDLLTGATVAVKVMRVDPTGSADLRARVRNEALLGARLGALHPNILTVRDMGIVGDRLFIVTDWVEGGSLLRWCGRLSLQACTTIVAQCGQALRTAHAEGVLHTDVCPDNVLYELRARRAVLCDFGLATALDGHAEWLGRIAPVHRRPAYLPPPGHAAHPPPLGKAMDVYALATMLRALLTGSDRQVGEEPDEMTVAHTGQPVPSMLADLVRRYTVDGLHDDDANRFLRDLWRAAG